MLMCRPYSVLLPVGFAVPPLLPGARCALTAPFHSDRPGLRRGLAVCSLWHCPWGRPRRALPGTVVSWSPDFPRAASRPRSPDPLVSESLRRRGPSRKCISVTSVGAMRRRPALRESGRGARPAARRRSKFRDVGRRDAPPASLARVRPRGATGRAAASHPPAGWGGGARGGSCGIRRRPRRRPARGGSGAGRPSSRPSCR